MQPIPQAELRLLNRWQRDMPLLSRPFGVMGAELGMSEDETLRVIGRLLTMGVITRVGATLKPNTVGASLLAAMRVPKDKLETVAKIVNHEEGVNHNYERLHDINLWFVLTGANRDALRGSLDRIRTTSGFDVLELPLERSYFIDLGFAVDNPSPPVARSTQTLKIDSFIKADEVDIRLLAAIEHGLPIVPRPYAAVGAVNNVGEDEVLRRLTRLIGGGLITRLGLIVRHRSLGFNANAMAVWDVPDGDVDGIGVLLAKEPSVTLCYRRKRQLPIWPFNLFVMVHGRERAAVAREISRISSAARLDNCPSAVLFSGRCFRQRGPSLKAS